MRSNIFSKKFTSLYLNRIPRILAKNIAKYIACVFGKLFYGLSQARLNPRSQQSSVHSSFECVTKTHRNLE